MFNQYEKGTQPYDYISRSENEGCFSCRVNNLLMLHTHAAIMEFSLWSWQYDKLF